MRLNSFKLSKNETRLKSQLENISECLNYILESERVDFDENPSVGHIYFQAYSAWYGIKSAETMLLDTIKDNQVDTLA